MCGVRCLMISWTTDTERESKKSYWRWVKNYFRLSKGSITLKAWSRISLTTANAVIGHFIASLFHAGKFIAGKFIGNDFPFDTKHSRLDSSQWAMSLASRWNCCDEITVHHKRGYKEQSMAKIYLIWETTIVTIRYWLLYLKKSKDQNTFETHYLEHPRKEEMIIPGI